MIMGHHAATDTTGLLLTPNSPLWEPHVIRDVVGHVWVQVLQELQHVVNEENGVIVPIEDPLVGVGAQSFVGHEGCKGSPASRA